MNIIIRFASIVFRAAAAVVAGFPLRRPSVVTLRTVSAALLLCLAAGCAGTGPTLKPEVVSTVTCTGVRRFLPQGEVKAEYILSGYGSGGGLIGAVIDAGVNSSRQHNAEKRVQELRERVKDVDFRRLYWQAISNAVMGISWLKADKVEDISGTTLPPVTKQMVAQRAVLNVGADYYISQDCRVFVVSTGLGFFPPGRHGRPTAANILTYHSAEIGEPDAEKAIALWAEDGGAAFRKAVAEGITESAKLAGYALQYMGGAPNPSAPPVTIRARLLHARVDYGMKAGRVAMKGTIVENGADRLIFRNTAGRFFSLPRRDVEVN